MRALVDPNSELGRRAFAWARERALATGRQVLYIRWEAEGEGEPVAPHPDGVGYIQWSVRPFRQRQGCDGTIDDNVHYIGIRLCESLGLDYGELYRQAYPEEPTEWIEDQEWLNQVAIETEVPELSVEALKGLLHDLHDINNRTLGDLLQETFEGLGYDVARWW